MKLPTKHTVYFYSLFDPRNNKHFYAGRTQDINQRVKAHLAESIKGSSKKDKRIKTIKSSGYNIGVKIHYTIQLDAIKFHQSLMLESIEHDLINTLIIRNHTLYNKHTRQGSLTVNRGLYKKVRKESSKRKIQPGDLVQLAVTSFLSQ